MPQCDVSMSQMPSGAMVHLLYALTLPRCRYTAKFSLRPPHLNADVNLTVAWWGHARGNAV
jgi:hypothetical protein